VNLWRLLSARIRGGRLRVFIVMCAVALVTGAVIIGLSERLTADPDWEMPAGIAGALIAISAAGFGQTWASTRIGQWIAGLSRQIRRAILTHYVALEPLAVAEIDRDAMQDALVAMPRGLARLGAEAPAAIQSFLTTVACVVGTLMINPVAGAALLLAMKLGAITTTALVVRARGGSLATQMDDSGVDRAMDATFRGVRQSLLAASGVGAAAETPFEVAIAARRVARKRRLAWIATEGAAAAMGRPLLAALVVVATRLSNEPADQAVAMLLIAFLVPFDWIEAIPRLTSLSAAADRLAAFETALRNAAQRWAPPSAAATRDFASLELRDAIFRYAAQPGQPGAIVGPVSCRVAPGRILFVTGGIGSGKTSVLSVLAGLAVPEGGSVLRDGVMSDPRRSRDLAAYVPTDPVLFAGTHIPNVARPDIQQWIEDLDLGGFAEIKAGRVPGAEDLPRGVRTRVALLIAIAEDRPLLLLDEWDARQSPTMRDRYYNVILPRLRDAGRALVVATGDERRSGLANEIICLRDGRQV